MFCALFLTKTFYKKLT